MADVIISAEGLATGIADYEDKKERFNTACQNLNNVMENLKTNYKSEAANALYNKFAEMYDNLKQVDARMESAVTELKQLKELLETRTAQQQQWAQAIQKDVNAPGAIFL